jgi:catechol 2,3-dioxygenase-like lactoylglutathione lyase family enzyme
MTAQRRLAMVSLVVREYDEAIDFFTRVMGFRLLEDTPMSATKRWVVVAPDGGHGAALLLARAASPAQEAAIGQHAGGRVGFFLHTARFDTDLARLRCHGVRFAEDAVRDEAFGRVIVFLDLYGNKWDLIESRTESTP